MATMEDVLQFAEARAATITDLVGHIKVVMPNEPEPSFRDYGFKVYFGREDWHELIRNKIGPIYTEVYRINADLVFNRRLASRQVFSDAKGISYWNDILIRTFLNQRNSNTFKDCKWEPEGTIEKGSDSVVLKGVLTVRLENQLS